MNPLGARAPRGWFARQPCTRVHPRGLCGGRRLAEGGGGCRPLGGPAVPTPASRSRSRESGHGKSELEGDKQREGEIHERVRSDRSLPTCGGRRAPPLCRRREEAVARSVWWVTLVTGSNCSSQRCCAWGGVGPPADRWPRRGNASERPKDRDLEGVWSAQPARPAPAGKGVLEQLRLETLCSGAAAGRRAHGATRSDAHIGRVGLGEEKRSGPEILRSNFRWCPLGDAAWADTSEFSRVC